MKLPKEVIEIAKVFNKNNFQIYIVGGAVRDNLLGIPNMDFDFATDALPQDVIKLFKKVVPIGIEHGTVLVLYKGFEFEVTTFRIDGKYSDNRRPDNVTFVRSLKEDLIRRDFTINAFAWDILENKLIDEVNGIEDLNQKIIKAIGDPEERFKEDALRMIRGCRFAAKLNFKIEEKTLEAMQKLNILIKNISAERIRDELIKIMETEKPSIAFEYLRISGLLDHILPELLAGYGVFQNKFHKYDVYYHNLYSCDAAPKDNYIVRFASLFHDIAKPQTKKGKKEECDNEEDNSENSFYNHEIIGEKIAGAILKRLKFSNEEIKKIRHLIRHHMFYYTDQWTDGAVRRFIRKVGLENIQDLFLLRDADRIGNGMKQGIPKAFIDFKDRIQKIIEEDNAFKIEDLDINGYDIMETLNIKPGPIIGEILNHLLEIVLDNPELNKKEILIQETKKYYEAKQKISIL
ncbi:MAG TPA: HD domain-containing protein [Spirochaetota bacterium]|nr:HD domain-containing protein [Spirochaetota bacterium]HOL58221.1 HD domain-containing protein [Spirochaetota bacterium]HPP05705.1 HD domain-containing protein [Spirochaetota bacterium]